jgi:CspA family cold shock protein
MSSSKDSVTMLKGTTSDERLIGRVKWFNNKAGYGFITVTDGSQAGSDIFVHHSAIGVTSQQYKYLVQGEYVEFSISATQNSTHAFQASNICGIKGGKLMCETRNEFKQARSAYKTTGEHQESQTQTVTEPVKLPRQQKAPKPQTNDEEQKDWTLIKGSKTPSAQDSGVPTNTSAGRGSTQGRGSASGRGRGRPRTQPTK